MLLYSQMYAQRLELLRMQLLNGAPFESGIDMEEVLKILLH